MNKLSAEEYLGLGDLTEALNHLQDQIRAQPENVKHRIFLFQLLCVQGQWERALTQLTVASELDDSTLAMVSMYRQVIACELFREQVFLGNKEPVIFGKPEEWIALLVQALKLTAQGEYSKSQQVRVQAFEAATVTSGVIDEQPFEWFADSDSRLGPVMEVIIDGRYLWVPLENINTIVIDEPTDLRDVVWLPAHFAWHNGGENYVLIPSRYPQSYLHEPLLALSRKTEWQDCGVDLFLGLGQKTWATNIDEYPVMDIRSIQFNSSNQIEEE